MPLQLLPVTEADAPRIVELEHLVYKDDCLTPILFPGPFPADASAKRANEVTEQVHADPTATWLKVVDIESDELAAFAKWNIYKPGIPRPRVPGRSYGEGCNEPACKQFWGVMDEKRQQHMSKTPHAWLDLLQTDPKYQRRGAGSMLIRWGTDMADSLGIHAYLESSPMARGLYSKHGFEDIDEMLFDMSSWGGQGTHTTTYMLRPIPHSGFTSFECHKSRGFNGYDRSKSLAPI